GHVGRCGVALAVAVPPRLGSGGAVSPVRTLHLTQRLVDVARRAWLPGAALLACVDGLPSDVTASWRANRAKVRTGRRGRPPYRLPGRVWRAQGGTGYWGGGAKEGTPGVRWGGPEGGRGRLVAPRT